MNELTALFSAHLLLLPKDLSLQFWEPRTVDPPPALAFFQLRMGFFRKIAGLLRSAKDDLHESKDETDDQARTPTQLPMEQTGLPRKGISIPVQVAVDRPRNQIVPLLAPCTSGDGGVQVRHFSIFFPIIHFVCFRAFVFIVYCCVTLSSLNPYGKPSKVICIILLPC